LTTPAITDLSTLVHPKERIYYAICIALSLLVYAWAAFQLFSGNEVAGVMIVYGAMFGVGFWMLHAVFLGRLRGNAVRVSERQFPDLHEIVVEQCRALEMEVPDVFVTQAGGMLNAFATKFFRRRFVIVYSEIVELAREQGEPAVRFVVAHELAHIKRRHVNRRWLIFPATLIPFLGSAYSRAREYTCDRFGAHLAPDGAVSGLLVLAAGKRLYREVDTSEYVRQTNTEDGFWFWFAEKTSTHPNLTKRVAAVRHHAPGRAPERTLTAGTGARA
jgi:Zn-dependent protease with chaperone function